MIKIRLITKNDYEAVSLLRRETISFINAKDYSENVIDDWVKDKTINFLEKDEDGTERWIALINDEIVGFCEYNLKGEIIRLYTDTNHLRKGIGSQLLQHAEKLIKKIGFTKVFVESTITAKKFYEKNGYNLIEKSIYKSRNIESVVYKMEKKIS